MQQPVNTRPSLFGSGQSYEGDSLDQSHKEIKERGSFARERKSTIEQHNASIKNQGREVLLLGES